MDPGSVFERSHELRIGEVDAFVAEVGAGPDVVFVHGNPDRHTLWDEVARRLAPELRCLAPDLPGFGRSRAPRRFDCSLANQAAYVTGVLDGLGLDRAHLVVHDIGGVYGLAFAATHPARLRSLTIFNTAFAPDFRWHTAGKLWRTPIVGELVMWLAPRRWYVGGYLADAPAMPRGYAERAAAELDRWSTKRMILRWYRYMDFARRLPGWDTRLAAALQAHRVPTQVIWGTRDRFVPARFADRFAAPVHRLDACGHWAMVEDPDAAARLVSAHVRAAEATTAAG